LDSDVLKRLELAFFHIKTLQDKFTI